MNNLISTNESGALWTKVVTNTYEAYQVFSNPGELMSWSPWAEMLCRFNHLMLAVNASINILIYVAKVSLLPQVSRLSPRS